MVDMRLLVISSDPRRLEFSNPGLYRRESLLLHRADRRVDLAIDSTQVGAVEAVANSDWLAGSTDGGRAVGGHGSVAPGVACW